MSAKHMVAAQKQMNQMGRSTREFQPHKYQQEAILHLLKNPHAGLFLNPGLGKTAITLQAFKLLWMNNAATRALIIAPLRVIYNVWPDEIEKWETFNQISFTILHGPKKEERLVDDVDLYLINPEGVKWLAGTKFWDRVDMLIIDESSLWKTANTQRFRALKPFLSQFRRRVILTGTPAPNGLMQIWSQMFLLDLGLRLEQFITRFRRKYFYQHRHAAYSDYELMEDGAERIYARINDVVMHRSNDVLDLPELVNSDLVVDMPPDIKKQYETLKAELIIEIGEKGVKALNRGVLSMKLRQLASGGIYSDDKTALWLHDAKVDALRELVEESQGQPVLVFYQFRHELERLRMEFGAPYLGGRVSAKDSTDIIDRWNADKIPVLLLQPQAGGHGLNLQQGTCSTAVWFSIPWDLEYYEQATARLWRQGQDKTVVLHHIIARGTVDRKIARTLIAKGDVQKALMEALI